MKHPMQYQETVNGIDRFVENKLVSWLIDQLPEDMNTLAEAHANGIGDTDDWDQILQLIGYSVFGIPYHDREKFNITDEWKNPENEFEHRYHELKDSLRPIVSEIYNIHPDDLY